MNTLLLATRMAWALGLQHDATDILSAIVRHAHSPEEVAIAVEWTAHESGFRNQPRAVAYDAKDGAARCFLQVHAYRHLELDECASQWFQRLHAGETMCGSLEGGLAMVSSGHCDWVRPMVERRLDEAMFLLALAR